MPAPSRRAFLAGGASTLAYIGVAPAFAAPGLGPSQGDRVPRRTSAGRMRLSIAAYSYRDLLTAPKGKTPAMDLFQFVDLAASLGCDAVEPTSYYVPQPLPSDFLARLKTRAFRLGLDVSGTAVGNDFCLPDGPGREKSLRMVRDWIDHAVVLGAPVIRIFAGTTPKGETEDVAVARAIAGIKASLPHAEANGVTLALENHGGITATPAQLLRLVRAIDSPNFGVNLDTGNFHGEDPYAEIAEIAPYAVNVQVKTEISRAGRPKEAADLKRIVKTLREVRYSGYVVLEYEAAEDPHRAIPGHLKTLRSLIES